MAEYAAWLFLGQFKDNLLYKRMTTKGINMKSPYLRLAAFIAFGIALLASYLLTGKNGFWFTVDEHIFRFFNDRLVPGSAFLSFTAYTNMRIFDVVAFAAMGGVYYYYYRKADSREKRRMLAIGLLMLLTAIAVKQCGRFIPISHPSPSLFFEDANRLTQLTDIVAKDASGNSFPGDHGMMLMIFAAFMARYFGLRAFVAAICLVAVFSMPRIMSGAHWFSDIYAGSLSIVCIFVSALLLTPASDYFAARLERLAGLLTGRFFRM